MVEREGRKEETPTGRAEDDRLPSSRREDAYGARWPRNAILKSVNDGKLVVLVSMLLADQTLKNTKGGLFYGVEIVDWINAVKVRGTAVSRGVMMPIEPLSLAIIGLTLELAPCLAPLGGLGRRSWINFSECR